MRTDRENQAHSPPALFIILHIVFCERVATSVILGLGALYLREHRGLDPSRIFFLIGGMMGGSYLLSMPAGLLADGRLGHQRAALSSLLLLLFAQLALLSDEKSLLWPALALNAVGLALYRVTIPTLLGRLYAPNDARRGSAFSRFYGALNLGYLAGPLGGEWVRGRYGWPPVFLLSTTAIFVALATLMFGYRRLQRETSHRAAPVIELGDFSQRERAIYTLCALAVIFWLAMQQSSTSLTFFAEENTAQFLIAFGHRLALRAGHFAVLHGLLVLVLTGALLEPLARWRQRGAGPPVPVTLAFGLLAAAAAFALMSAACLYGALPRASVLWLGGAYLLLSIGEVLYSALGLSLVNELAPRRRAGLFGGLWFAAVAFGNLGAGALGILWTRLPHHRYFASIAALLFVAALLLLQRSRGIDAAIGAERRAPR